MTSAIKLVLGVSFLAVAASSAACSSSGSGSGGAVPIAGSSNATGGTGGTGSGIGGTGGAPAASGVPLTPTTGWVDGASNMLGIQGAFFTYADPTTLTSLTGDTMSSAKICMKGVAAKVDMNCTPPAGMDCYGVTWGAAIGFNLNQPNMVDPTDPTKMVGGTAVPYDASAIKGFSFTIDGATVPLPKDFRFNIEDATTQYCTSVAKGVKPGVNTYAFGDVVAKCYLNPVPTSPTAATIQTGVVKISWQIVTNTGNTVPFDFCVSNLVALQ